MMYCLTPTAVCKESKTSGEDCCCTHRANAAFTLVELLVVIGIIALLIAMLLPALKKARDQANAAVCLSNQKQLAMTFILYANDNKGILPPYGYMLNDFNHEVPNMDWYDVTSKYVSKAGNQLGVSFMRCPSELDPAAARHGSYGVNYGYSLQDGVVTYYTVGFTSPYFTGSKKITQVKPGTFLSADCLHWTGIGDVAIYSPYSFPLDMDVDGDGVKDSYSGLYATTPYPSPYNHIDPRHAKAAIFSFIDGSARRVSIRDWAINKDQLWGK